MRFATSTVGWEEAERHAAADRGVDPLVFWGSTGVATAFVLWGVLGTDSLASVMGSVLDWVITNFGWAFVLIAPAR